MDPSKPSRRSPATAVPRSPRLPESRRSITPQSSPRIPVTRSSRSAASSPRPSVDRPRSTLKLKTTTTATSGDDSIRPSPHSLSMRRARSTLTGSPSAWALSPGRPFPLPPSSPSSPSPSLNSSSSSLESSTKGRSLSTSVLRYFQRQKKVSPEEEERFHQYRMMHNSLLQWRFANAKSEASLRIVQKKAEAKLFAVWVKVCKMRTSIADKGSRVERLRLKIKLLGIVCPQLQLLYEWEVVDKRNSEAIARIAKKLSAFSMKLPLVHGAKVDIIDLYEAMCSAMEVLQDIEMNITNFLSQAEETCYILTELISVMGEHDKCFQELDKAITAIVSLEVEEESLRANVMQAGEEVWERQNSCKYHRFVSFRRRAIGDSGGITTFNPLFSLLNVS